MTTLPADKEPVAFEVNQENDGSQAEPGALQDVTIDPKEESQLLARLDLFLVPVIMLAYLTCFLDRSNIGKQ